MQRSRRRRAALTAILTTFTLGACSGTSWTKVEATSEELDRDRSICARYARGIGEAEAARTGMERLSRKATALTFRRCMEGRGWVEERDRAAADTGH